MAGIYVHIPFCKSRCIYCDFYSTTLLGRREWYVGKLCEEMTERSRWLGDTDFTTMYIGGGTPSQLTFGQLETIVGSLHRNFNVKPNPEFTVEVNPDDVSTELITHLSDLGVNRISMGIQTFADDRLHFLHRRHSAEQAVRAVETCHEAGMTNVSIDLMFGFPGETLKDWETDIDKALSLDVRHISAYSLMYEEGTELTSMVQKGCLTEIDEELSADMYAMLMDKTRETGFEHYEISNFCKPGYHSRHNSSYWGGIPYIGLGAGAHSFNGKSRQWNGPMTDEGWTIEDSETLTPAQIFNEKIMTGLRTSRGVDTEQLRNEFPDYFSAIEPEIDRHIKGGKLQIDTHLHRLTLTHQGIFVSNAVMADLMTIEN